MRDPQDYFGRFHFILPEQQLLEDCVSWMEELLAVADVAGNLMTVVWSGDHLAAGRKARWS